MRRTISSIRNSARKVGNNDGLCYFITYHRLAMSITTDRQYMALAERKEVKDHIGIYDVNTWILVMVLAIIITRSTSISNDI
jgi:hypothetical protein